jgi:hypothetical protein
VKLGPQRSHCLLDITDQPLLNRRAPPNRLGPDIDLGDTHISRVELPIGKVGAEHQQRIAGTHRIIAGRESDQPGHADVKGIVPFHMLLAAHRVDDRCFQRGSQRNNFVMRAGHATAA